MPTYCFSCPKCGFTKEEMRTISKRNDPQPCDKCKTEMDKLIGTGSCLIFKGEGFYCNDYPKDKGGNDK